MEGLTVPAAKPLKLRLKVIIRDYGLISAVGPCLGVGFRENLLSWRRWNVSGGRRRRG